MSFHTHLIGAALAVAMSAGSALALGANVTPGIIFGSGNDNGGFKIESSGALELGLRAKLRYDVNGAPQNIFPFDGVDTYTFDPADGNAPAGSGRAIWNFEWAIFTGLGGSSASVFDYTFDLMIVAPDGATANGSPLLLGAFGKSPSGIFNPVNINQGSQNLGFDLDGPLPTWPFASAAGTGKFTFTLTANEKHGSGSLSNTIHVNVVPVPAALPLLGVVFVALGVAGWRKRRAALA